jgi:hypothetical protein
MYMPIINSGLSAMKTTDNMLRVTANNTSPMINGAKIETIGNLVGSGSCGGFGAANSCSSNRATTRGDRLNSIATLSV